MSLNSECNLNKTDAVLGKLIYSVELLKEIRRSDNNVSDDAEYDECLSTAIESMSCLIKSIDVLLSKLDSDFMSEFVSAPDKSLYVGSRSAYEDMLFTLLAFITNGEYEDKLKL